MTNPVAMSGDFIRFGERFVLDDDKTVGPADDLQHWCRNQQRWHNLAVDRVGQIAVSTIFAGVHLQPWSGLPVLFETMAFTAAGEVIDSNRYSDFAAAIAGHKQIVARLGHADETWRAPGVE